MRMLALLALFVGLGVLAAQEPQPLNKKDGPPPKGSRGGKGDRPMRGGPISWKKLIDDSDADKDGLLSKDELSKNRNMWDRWQKADVDKDGKISEKEFNDYQKKVLEKFRGKKSEDKKKD